MVKMQRFREGMAKVGARKGVKSQSKNSRRVRLKRLNIASYKGFWLFLTQTFPTLFY